MILPSVIAALLGLALSWAAIPPILRLSPRLSTLRVRDFHHTNKAPIPRYGGLALAVSLIGLEVFLHIFEPPPGRLASVDRMLIILSSLAMFAIGFLDDIRPLGAKKKLAGQTLVALLVWIGGIGVETFKLPVTGTIIQLGPWGGLITILWLVGICNLINLIDGVDGLAGGICFMLLALTAYTGQATPDLALLAAGMAGAVVGFLRFNFPPARIYLGDGGAYFLGFQIGIYSLVNSQKGTILAAMVAPLFVLALPIVDTSIAILRRGLRGLPIFRADRRHIHHHLLGMGWSRRRVVLWTYTITAMFMVLGVIAFWSRGTFVPVLLGVGVMILLIAAGRLSFSREWFAVGRVVGNSLEMRQEIQYALLLSRWLALEGGRCKSTEDLWEDLAFAARKLRFAAVSLTLDGRKRVWTDASVPCNLRTVLFEFQASGAGAVEFTFPDDLAEEGDPAPLPGAPSVSLAANLFEILAELIAEGWLKAMSQWHELAARPDAPAVPSARLVAPARQIRPREPRTAPIAKP